LTASTDFFIRLFRGATSVVFLLGYAAITMAQEVPIIQPGAPGDSARELSAEEAIEIANTSYSPDDAQFMTDMIPHHNQAMPHQCITGRRDIVHAAMVARAW